MPYTHITLYFVMSLNEEEEGKKNTLLKSFRKFILKKLPLTYPLDNTTIYNDHC